MFLGVASIIKPNPRDAGASVLTSGSRSSASPVAHAEANSTGAPDHPKGWKLLGMLEGREHIVKCWASPEGPRYSVYTLDGRMIQADLPADEVYRGFPDVDLPNLRTDPPSSSPSSSGGLVDFVDVWRD
jgi:hypothetical protein